MRVGHLTLMFSTFVWNSLFLNPHFDVKSRSSESLHKVCLNCWKTEVTERGGYESKVPNEYFISDIYLFICVYIYLPICDCALVNRLGDSGLLVECPPWHWGSRSLSWCPKIRPQGGAPLCVGLQTWINVGGLVRICFSCFFFIFNRGRGAWLRLHFTPRESTQQWFVHFFSEMPLLILMWSTFWKKKVVVVNTSCVLRRSMATFWWSTMILIREVSGFWHLAVFN